MTEKNPPRRFTPHNRDDHRAPHKAFSPRREREPNDGNDAERPSRYSPRTDDNRGSSTYRDRPYRTSPRDDARGSRPYHNDKPFHSAARHDGGDSDKPRRYTPRGENERGDRPYHSAPIRNDGFSDRPRPFSPDGDRPKRERAFSPDGDRPRRAFSPDGDRPRKPFSPDGDRPRKPFSPDGDRPRRAFSPDGDRPRKPFSPDGDRPRRPFSPDGDRPRRPFSPDGDRPRRPFSPDGDRPRRPFLPDGDRPRRPFSPDGDRPRRAFSPDGDRPRRAFSPDGDRPSYSQQRAERFDAQKPRYSSFPEQNDDRVMKLRPRKKRDEFEDQPSQAAPHPPRVRSIPEFTKEDMRLNKFLSNSGLCSRREADEFIAAGLVTVNDEVVTRMGVRVKSTDDIRYNGERLLGEEKVYILMNKPKDFVTTTEDPHAEQTVLDLIAGKCEQRVYPVGRLDKSTTGVLLITNDGALTDQLTHPSYNRKKIYQVDLDKNLKRTDMEALAKGIELEDGEAHVDEISYVDENEKKIGVEIHSGRNRIIRRMFEHLGYEVKKLDRVYFAGLTKKRLRRGAWRFLTSKEIAMLKMGSYE